MVDIMKVLETVSGALRGQRSEYHLTLGKLVAVLEKADGEDVVRFSHNGRSPCSPDSYRGYYADLAFRAAPLPTKASELLEVCRDCVGKEFIGYKGGEFVMGEDTPLWCAEYGECGLAIVSSQVKDGEILLVTKEEKD